MNAKYQCFLLGYSLHAGIDMFSQDMRGLEGYINYIRSAWIDISPLWGFGIIAISLIAFANTKYNH